MGDKPDDELVELFEYYFGIDLREPKHLEARQELAAYFTRLFQQSLLDFQARTLHPSKTNDGGSDV